MHDGPEFATDEPGDTSDGEDDDADDAAKPGQGGPEA
jgi:hypothetical protein